jgi:hypothetical protein
MSSTAISAGRAMAGRRRAEERTATNSSASTLTLGVEGLAKRRLSARYSPHGFCAYFFLFSLLLPVFPIFQPVPGRFEFR